MNEERMAAEFIEITGQDLSSESIVRVARRTSHNSETPRVMLHPATRIKLEKIRKYIEKEWLRPSAPAIYGVNTGCGTLRDRQLPTDEISEFNRLYTVSHCVGAGEPLKREIVRASMYV